MSEQTKETKRQTATRKKVLFKKHKKFIGSVLNKADFKEPIVQLIRRNRRVEYYEGIKSGEWIITHTDGMNRTLYLYPEGQLTFDYGKDTFQGYIMHEDFPLPLPEDPVITTEMVNLTVEKNMYDMKKWKVPEIKAQTDMIKVVIYGLIGLVVAFTFFKMMVPSDPAVIQQAATTTAEAAKEVAKTVTENATQIIARPVTIIN